MPSKCGLEMKMRDVLTGFAQTFLLSFAADCCHNCNDVSCGGIWNSGENSEDFELVRRKRSAESGDGGILLSG